MDKRGLMKLKGDIDTAKTQISMLKGSQQTLLSQLEKTWGCGAVKEADEKLELMKKKNERLSGKITEGLQEIEDKYINK